MPSEPRPESPVALEWRQWVTTRLVPVVAHRANNAVAALLGTTDLLAREPERQAEHLDATHAGAKELGEFLGAFSRFSKGGDVAGDAEVGGVLREASRLVGAVVHEAAGRLECRTPGTAVPVGVDAARLEQWLVALVTSTLVDLEAPRDGRGPHCRVRLEVRGPKLLSVRLAFDRPSPEAFGAQGADAVLADLDAELRSVGGALRAHSSGSACAYRLDLPALADLGSLGISEAPRATGSRRSMLVFLEEPMLAELVKAVLAECGIDAEIASRPEDLVAGLAEPSWSLFLAEVDRFDPALVERCRERASSVALLTSGAPPLGDWYGVLPMPFRPKELMDFLAEA